MFMCIFFLIFGTLPVKLWHRHHRPHSLSPGVADGSFLVAGCSKFAILCRRLYFIIFGRSDNQGSVVTFVVAHCSKKNSAIIADLALSNECILH